MMKTNWISLPLDSVASIDYGTRVVQKKDGGSIYPVYGGGGETFRMDKFNRQDILVISRFAMSAQCTRFVRGPFFLNDSGLTVSTKSNSLSQAFLEKYLIAHNDDIYLMGKGMAQRNLDMPSFRKFIVSFPESVKEQQRIVDELDLLTGIIDKKNAQLRDLDALAQSIFYEMFGDPNANSLNWPSSSFKDIFKLKSGDGLKEKDFVTGQFPVYGGNGISGYHNAFNKEGKHIIIGRVGAYCGNVRVVEDCFWLTDNAFDAFFDSSVLDYYFASWLLNTLDLHRFANHAAQPVISNSGLKDLLIILPPIEIQRHFSERVLAILQQKSSISNSIIDVERLLSERMDAYFS